MKNLSHDGLLRLKLTVGLAVITLFSLFFSVFISAFLNGTFTGNFSEALECCNENGFSTVSFAAVFLVLAMSAGGALFRSPARTVHPIDKNRVISDKDNYGKADFEMPWQYRNLVQIRPVENCVGHIYGMLDDKAAQCLDFFPDPNDPTSHLNGHIFAIGASGSGKTFSVGKTYCYQSIKLGHSVIHSDPKGELFSELASVYRKHGYIVRRLNFNNPVKSDGWDCLKSIRTAKSTTEKEILVDRFASAVISQISDNPNSIYYSGPEMLLKALLLRLLLDPGYSDEEKNIRTIYSWVTDPGGIQFLQELFNPSKVPPAAAPCLGPWGTFNGGSEALKGNLIINLASGISALGTDIIGDILSTDDMDISLPGIRKCAYFVQFPVPNDAYRFPVALFFTMLFEALQSSATRSEGHRLPNDVDFFLDEFAQCGIFPRWDQRISVIRSFGINVFMIVQTITQFELLYKKSQDTIISNCATWLMLGSNDHVSADMFCRRIGQTTIDVHSEATRSLGTFFGGKDKKLTVGTGKTSLLTPDEIMKLPPNTLLIVLQRHNPIWANSIPSTLHPYDSEAEIRHDRDEPFFYDTENVLNDFPMRAERHSAEKKFIEEYELAHKPFSPPRNIDDAPYANGPVTPLSEIYGLISRDAKALFSPLRAFASKNVLRHHPEGKKRSEGEFEAKNSKSEGLKGCICNADYEKMDLYAPERRSESFSVLLTDHSPSLPGSAVIDAGKSVSADAPPAESSEGLPPVSDRLFSAP